MDVTVVIPFWNDAGFIREKLANCLRLKSDRIREVILVDDYSEDQGPQIVREIIGQATTGPKVRLLKNRYDKGKVGALRTGFASTETRYVCVTDVDILVREDAVDRLLGVIGGDERVGLVFGEIDRYHSLSQLLIHQLMRFMSYVDSPVSCTGQLFLFRKDVPVGLEDTSIADDLEIPIQIRENGYSCKRVPTAVFEDMRVDTEDAVAARRRIVGLYQALLGHWRIFGNPKFGKYGLICFPLFALFFPGMCVAYLGTALMAGYLFYCLSPWALGLFVCTMLLVPLPRNLTCYVWKVLWYITSYLVTRNAKCGWRTA